MPALSNKRSFSRCVLAECAETDALYNVSRYEGGLWKGKKRGSVPIARSRIKKLLPGVLSGVATAPRSSPCAIFESSAATLLRSTDRECSRVGEGTANTCSAKLPVSVECNKVKFDSTSRTEPFDRVNGRIDVCNARGSQRRPAMTPQRTCIRIAPDFPSSSDRRKREKDRKNGNAETDFEEPDEVGGDTLDKRRAARLTRSRGSIGNYMDSSRGNAIAAVRRGAKPRWFIRSRNSNDEIHVAVRRPRRRQRRSEIHPPRADRRSLLYMRSRPFHVRRAFNNGRAAAEGCASSNIT